MKNKKQIACIFWGGLGDNLSNNRWTLPIKEKYQDCEITAYCMKGAKEPHDYPSQCLRDLYGDFYKKIIYIPDTKYKKCLIQDNGGQIHNHPHCIENIPKELEKKLKNYHKVYNFDSKDFLWNYENFDFNWYAYFNFFPAPKTDKTVELPEEDYVIFQLHSSSGNVHKISQEWAEELVAKTSEHVKCYVIDDGQDKSRYDWVYKYEQIKILKSSIKELSSYVSKAKIFVGVDSGLKYLAFGHGVPCVLFYKLCETYGQPHPEAYYQWLPWPHYVYPLDIEVDSVFVTIMSICDEKLLGHFPYPLKYSPIERYQFLNLYMRDGEVINEKLA